MLTAIPFDRRRKKRVPGLSLRVFYNRDCGLFANSHVGIWNPRFIIATPAATQPQAIATAAPGLVCGRGSARIRVEIGKSDTESFPRREVAADVCDGERSQAHAERPLCPLRTSRAAASTMARKVTFDVARSSRDAAVQTDHSPEKGGPGPVADIISARHRCDRPHIVSIESNEPQTKQTSSPVAMSTQTPAQRDTIFRRAMQTVMAALGKLKRMYTTGEGSSDKVLLPHLSLVSSGVLVAIAAVIFISYTLTHKAFRWRMRRRH
ncbi:membrane protein US8A [Psittacid alphaherpesvirus 1]|uniref:membrane protein US8A n=1 Tax=Psittacid alphaherpesvirus 1 TaxID=50294 RepID=UPI000153681C|nr:membrane protein US8A [Psittacid alphaherpesvirus 1]